MKKQVLAIVMALVAIAAGAYTPNTKWPYLNEHFTEGTVYRGADYSVAKFNIHLQGNILHYINPEDDKIYTAKHNDVDSVVIAGVTFVPDKDMMMEVVAKNGENMVLKYDYADFAALNTTSGAYGSSANSSASSNYTSIELAGMNNPRHGLMMQEKNDGKFITMRTKYFLRIGKTLVEAKKGDIEDMLPADQKDAWKQFLKANKIKWRNPESLAKLLNFFK